MKIKYLIAILLAVTFLNQAQSQNLSVEQFKRQYDKIFEIEVVGPSSDPYPVVFVRKNAFQETHPLNTFTKKLNFAIIYLQNNYSNLDLRKAQTFVNDKVKLKEYVISELQNDSLFNQHFIPFVTHFLENQKEPLKNFNAPKPFHVSQERFMDILSKFYYAFNINPEVNRITWKVCVGGNEWFNPNSDSRPPKMDAHLPIIEAYAFQIAMSTTRNQELMKDFFSTGAQFDQELASIPHQTDRLESAREKMYNHMFGNEALEKFALKKYEEDKEFLPFRITD